MTPTTCKSCGAEILWAKTESGKAMPLDAEPNLVKGNIQLSGDECVVIRDISRFYGPLYTSHFATCPDHKQHRKRP